ncbi:MAG: hypothetical protein K6G80_04120 [Treponema sp.]|nr:hypothetical protein [Treponema sp.]
MKKICVTLYVLAAAFALSLASCASSASVEKPLWANHDTLDIAYPRASYIARLGTAETAGAAATLAEGELTSYFSHSVTVGTTATQTLDSTGQNKSSLTREVAIRSAMELFAVHKTTPWFDKTTKRYAVCAYIDRAEAWALYKPQVLSHREAFSGYYDKVVKESDAFKKIKLLHACEEAADTFAADLDFMRMLSPASEPEFAADRKRLASLSLEMSKARLSATMRVSVKDDEENLILRSLTGLLSGAGYYLTDAGYAYQVNAVVERNITKHSAGGETVLTATPGITVTVTNGVEKLFSYTRTFPRVTGFSEAFVHKKLYAAIESELQNSFLQEFRAALE